MLEAIVLAHLNYHAFEVLETAWHKLVKDLHAAKDLDELIDSHAAYILFIKRNVRTQCLCDYAVGDEGKRLVLSGVFVSCPGFHDEGVKRTAETAKAHLCNDH